MLKDEVHVQPVSVIVPDYACGNEYPFSQEGMHIKSFG